jgi:hypothetical protein
LRIEMVEKLRVIVDARAQRIRELEDLVEAQSEIMGALNREYGKNMYELSKLRGDF